MKSIVRSLALGSLVAVGMSGCSNPVNWKVTGKCEGSVKTCSIGGEIGGTFGGPKPPPEQSKAGALVIDVGGSTVDFPTTGSATLVLTNSETGATQASKSFAWVRSGTQIKLANPAAVDDWAYANGSASDTLRFQTPRFQSNFGVGTQMIQVATVYEGVMTASASSTFESCTPRGVYSRYACSGN